MTTPSHPRVRQLELVPLGKDHEGMYVLRDPHGYSGSAALPAEAAMLVTLMDGKRSLGQLRQEFERAFGKSLTLTDVERITNQLDDGYFLDNDRFDRHKSHMISEYRQLDVRPAAHAGAAYADSPDSLRTQLEELFVCQEGPGLLPREGSTRTDYVLDSERRLGGLMTPHIDFQHGGPTAACAFDRLVTESNAKLFVILGTAHTLLRGLFSVSRKHFETPLGTVNTDRDFIDSLADHLSTRLPKQKVEAIFDDEYPHRQEHSIEFQTVMLQYALEGRRDYKIVPILVGSFHPFVLANRSPGNAPEVAEFVSALRKTIDACPGEVCFIAGVDLAHIGQQFGDKEILSKGRLTEQWTDDQQLLAAACEGDPEAWFIHVAAQQDRNRICGLAPTYLLLETIRPERGEMLRYDQAVAADLSSCISFASVAFYV